MEDELKAIMADVLNIQKDKITYDISMDNCDTWDSLKHMELIVAIEQRFKITFTADEIVTMTNFAELKRLLKKRRDVSDGS